MPVNSASPFRRMRPYPVGSSRCVVRTVAAAPLFTWPATRTRVYRGRFPLEGTVLLGLDELDELVLVTDPVEVRIVLGEDPVLLVETDRLLQGGHGPALVPGERVGRGDPVVDHVVPAI